MVKIFTGMTDVRSDRGVVASNIVLQPDDEDALVRFVWAVCRNTPRREDFAKNTFKAVFQTRREAEGLHLDSSLEALFPKHLWLAMHKCDSADEFVACFDEALTHLVEHEKAEAQRRPPVHTRPALRAVPVCT